MPDPHQTPGPRRQDLVRRLASPMGGQPAVLAGYEAAGTVLTLAAMAWRRLRLRLASRASQRAARVAATAASLAS